MKTVFCKIAGILAVTVLLGMGCSRERHNADSENSPSETIGTEHLSAVSVVLKGKADLASPVSSDLQVGFQYSKSAGILPSNSTTVEATEADAQYNYTAPITGLEPATTYYFRSLIRQDGLDTYGETKCFTTKEVASMLEILEATCVEDTCATLNARLDLIDVLFEDIAYGFLWGTDESTLDHDCICPETTTDTIQAVLTGLSCQTQYWYRAYVTLDGQTLDGEVRTFTTKPYTAVAGEAIDLGLSVKWSSMNLGATSPEGYGDYFAWGENILKDLYSWETYQWCDGSYEKLTKYNYDTNYGTVDDKSELKDYDYEDDVARQALGGQWRIPTYAEWTELVNGCTWTWTTQNGVNGRLVTSNANGNSILLPAADCLEEHGLANVGCFGCYWSSSINTNNLFGPDNARCVWTSPDYVKLTNTFRYYGMSIRPVSE